MSTVLTIIGVAFLIMLLLIIALVAGVWAILWWLDRHPHPSPNSTDDTYAD